MLSRKRGRLTPTGSVRFLFNAERLNDAHVYYDRDTAATPSSGMATLLLEWGHLDFATTGRQIINIAVIDKDGNFPILFAAKSSSRQSC